MTTPTHILLYRSDRDEAGMVLVPIAGTIFEIRGDLT